MQQHTSDYGRDLEEEVPLRDYLLVVIRKWWVVASFFALAVAVAAALSFSAPRAYEARTKLLIVPRVSERLASAQQGGQQQGGQQRDLGASLSVETLSALATANDLLQQISAALGLRDPVSGRPWGVERLAKMMRPRVETASRGGNQAALPLLTMTVRGDDPALVKRIADEWAAAFVRQNVQLFATETARSYDFLSSQHEETQRALSARQQEKLAYQKANPLPSLQSQLDVATERYRDFLSQLQVSRAALVEAQARLAHNEGALAELRRRRAEKAAFQKANPVEPLQTELAALTARYQEFLSSIEQKQVALAEATARVRTLSPVVAAEPRVVTLRRSIPNDSLFAVLGSSVSPDKLKALANLELTEEEPNPVYFSLRAQLDQAQVEAAALAAEVRDLQSRVGELKSRMEQLAARADEIGARVSEFDDDIAALSLASAPLSAGLASAPLSAGLASAPLSAGLASARADVARLTSTVADLEKRTAQLEADVQRLADHIGQIQVDQARFDQDISVLTDNFNRLTRSVQEARIAKEEQGGSIRIVEAAVLPQEAVGPGRLRNILLGAILGAGLGVVAAFALHYLQAPRPEAQRPEPRVGSS